MCVCVCVCVCVRICVMCIYVHVVDGEVRCVVRNRTELLFFAVSSLYDPEPPVLLFKKMSCLSNMKEL